RTKPEPAELATDVTLKNIFTPRNAHPSKEVNKTITHQPDASHLNQPAKLAEWGHPTDSLTSSFFTLLPRSRGNNSLLRIINRLLWIPMPIILSLLRRGFGDRAPRQTFDQIECHVGAG